MHELSLTEIQISAERLERWRALCAWLEAQAFQRVKRLEDVPEHLRDLLEPDNADEARVLGLVVRTSQFWQLRPDHQVKLAYFSGDPETVAGMNGVRDRLIRLADKLLERIETTDTLVLLERGAPDRWATNWLEVAQGQRQAMNRVSVFAMRGYVTEIVRAVREVRRAAGIGG